MIRFTPITTCLIACIAASGTASATLRDDVARCVQLSSDSERLACFDAIDLPAADTAPSAIGDADRREMLAALDREFRFSPHLRTDELAFRLAISGELKISRDTAIAREVERLVKRIDKALAGKDSWGIAVTAHGASVAFNRGTPYTGEELADQAKLGLKRTRLTEDRFTVTIGEPAAPRLWDDGRIRDANEHLEVFVTGFK